MIIYYLTGATISSVTNFGFTLTLSVITLGGAVTLSVIILGFMEISSTSPWNSGWEVVCYQVLV